MSDSEIFRKFLSEQTLVPLSSEQVDRAVRFRERVCEENEKQNLTRLLTPKDFFEGHVLDVLHLRKTGWIEEKTLDLGSGMGVPGLLYALLFGGDWVFSDSETSKADFMARIIDEFRLGTARATNQRAEEYISSRGKEISTITSRAVGTVTKMFTWLSKSSTWNTLILFKGPKWEEEWGEFSLSSQRKRLEIAGEYSYSVGDDKKSRKLIRLRRK